jgi:hypothetical protein
VPSTATAGRQLVATDDAAGWLAVEQRLGLSEQFAQQEGLALRLLSSTLAGTPILTVQAGLSRGNDDSLTLHGLTEVERSWIDTTMPLPAHQRHGGWWLPEQVPVAAGVCDLPSLLRRHGEFGLASAVDLNVKLDATSGDAMFAYTVLQPLTASILAPLLLRSGAAPKQVAGRAAAWSELPEVYDDLGLDAGVPLTQMMPGPGWRSLSRHEQQRVRITLLDTLSEQVTLETVQRFRARQIAQLTAATYAKGKRAAMPLARTVLFKARQPILAAWFASDWVGFLNWLGEQPNPGEDVVTELPEVPLIVAQPGQAGEVARETGLSEDAVNAILLSFAGGVDVQASPGAASATAAQDAVAATGTPVADRIATIKAFFGEFDAVHTRQTSEMPSLWGLVDEGFYVIGDPNDTSRRHRQLLTAELNVRIDDLWQGTCLKRYPDRIVSEPHPHKQMAVAAGPALQVWQGVALTCWFICEGPYSRTTLPGLQNYYRRELKELEEFRHPIPTGLFRDLEAAEHRLGPEEPTAIDSTEHPVTDGLTITVSMSSGTRRRGFELLRDIVTAHRQSWVSEYLDAYLERRWRGELQAVGREYHRQLAGRGKAPTHKQFAGFAASAANHWFNGDLSGLYAALGERPPAQSKRVDLLPGDVYDLCWQTYRNLGGNTFKRDPIAHPETYGRNYELGRIAALVPTYIQLWEALDRPPTPQETNASRVNWPWPGGVDEAWPMFVTAIEDALAASERHFARLAAMLAQARGASETLVPGETPSPEAPQRRAWLLGRLRGR